MKKRDIQIVMLVVFIAVLAMILNKVLMENPKDANEVIIYIGSEEYKRVSLDKPQIVTINRDDKHNEIQITNEGVVMKLSNCDNQECIHQGEATLNNVDTRIMGGWIVCLPNEISIELLKGDTK